MRLAVIARNLFTRPDAPDRVELDAMADAAHVGVRLAAVVEVAQTGIRRDVEGFVVLELDDRHHVHSFRATPSLGHGDQFAGELADFSFRRDRAAGEDTLPMNPARAD